jgi:hypothetical protein
MKFRILVFTALIAFPGLSSSAKVTSPRPLFLERDVTLNGAPVPHGMYNLALESHGESVVATLWRENHVIATAHGTWVKHGVKYTQDAVLLKVNRDGTRSLVEIRIAGSDKTIAIDDENRTLRIAPETGGGGASSTNTFW